mmetsp:Transcript_9396/g.31823  ORF Transcript_9396/g.31823 Transcript_9396/m.31823 type:complete len:212 (-) Transcript_9396:586-1221(-)
MALVQLRGLDEPALWRVLRVGAGPKELVQVRVHADGRLQRELVQGAGAHLLVGDGLISLRGRRRGLPIGDVGHRLDELHKQVIHGHGEGVEPRVVKGDLPPAARAVEEGPELRGPEEEEVAVVGAPRALGERAPLHVARREGLLHGGAHLWRRGGLAVLVLQGAHNPLRHALHHGEQLPARVQCEPHVARADALVPQQPRALDEEPVGHEV